MTITFTPQALDLVIFLLGVITGAIGLITLVYIVTRPTRRP